MQTPALLALHGAKGVGKDTTFQFIQDWCAASDPALVAVRRGFADYAKWAFARQFFPTIVMDEAIKWVDEWKNDPLAKIAAPEQRTNHGPVYKYLPFRLCMAQFSTESARMLYKDTHWVDLLLPAEADEHNPEGWHGSFLIPPKPDDDPYSIADVCVVTDMRFDNELERVKQLGGLNVKIRRRDAEQAVIEEARAEGREIHESELGLPDDLFDVVISNNTNDLDDARRHTNLVMGEIKRNGIASIKRGLPLPWRIGI